MGSSARLALPLITLVTLGQGMLVSTAYGAEQASSSVEKTRTRLVTVGLDGTGAKVVLDAPGRYGAPEWSRDGKALLVNEGGKLWRVPIAGGKPAAVETGNVGWIDINHGLSPDGKRLAFTAGGMLFGEQVQGQRSGPARVVQGTPSYFHAWSPDGKWIAYSADRGSGYDVYMVAAAGGEEKRLTSDPATDDAPQYSPDGRFLYFLSDRGGTREIWRMPADGAGANDARAERMTRDERVEAAPHPSPDGRWLYFLSHPPRTPANVMDRDVLIRRIPLGAKAGKPQDIARLVGGHGTLGSRPFSPDGKTLVYATYVPPRPTVRIVLYTPSDLQAPAGASKRLTRIADAAERFLFDEMRGWKYPPSAKRIFRRSGDGTVEFVHVKGEKPGSDPSYSKASCRGDAVEKAKQQLRVEGEGDLWWVFLYVGDRPKRFSGWEGSGTPRDGGSAIVNYDTLPGEIQPRLGLEDGFNNQVFLKGMIHELGHAFGLPHIGPDPALRRGNSLMGANQDVYIERKYSRPDQVYLTEASAAMLWKHPVLSGTDKARQSQPTVKLAGYKAVYSRKSDRITLSGKLAADMPAHSVVVIDDLGKPQDGYWYRSHVGRIGSDGAFHVEIDHPAHAKGHFRILFCFENGMVTGDGVAEGDGSAIHKLYEFRNGGYRFGD